jgi:hypothetical protein
VIARLEFAWNVDPESWARSAERDPGDCWPELPMYLSACMGDLPMIDAAEATPRVRGGTKLSDQLDGRLRFEDFWAIEVEADAWVRARAEGAAYAEPVPAPKGRARLDLAEHIAWELFHLPGVVDTDAVLAVRHPYRDVYRPGDRNRGPALGSRWPCQPRANGRAPRYNAGPRGW